MTTAELELLADQRAEAIIDHLVSSAGVATARLRKNEITTVEPDAEGRIQLKFAVDAEAGTIADEPTATAPAQPDDPSG